MLIWFSIDSLVANLKADVLLDSAFLVYTDLELSALTNQNYMAIMIEN